MRRRFPLWLSELELLRSSIARMDDLELQRQQQKRPWQEGKVLLVGDARAFLSLVPATAELGLRVAQLERSALAHPVPNAGASSDATASSEVADLSCLR